MILAVSGWRGWTDVHHIEKHIGLAIAEGYDFIRFGDASGVDAIAGNFINKVIRQGALGYAGQPLDSGIQLSKYHADWASFGNAAGPVRNRAMLLGKKRGEPYEDIKADLLLAFPEPGRRPGPGSGTWGCMGEAVLNGIKVIVPAFESRELSFPAHWKQPELRLD